MKLKTFLYLIIVIFLSALISSIILGIAAAELGISFPNGHAVGTYNLLVSVTDLITVIALIWVFIKNEL